MNYAGAAAAAVAGPVLALGGFRLVNLVAMGLLVPAGLLPVVAVRRREAPTRRARCAPPPHQGVAAYLDGAAARADGNRVRSRSD